MAPSFKEVSDSTNWHFDFCGRYFLISVAVKPSLGMKLSVVSEQKTVLLLL